MQLKQFIWRRGVATLRLGLRFIIYQIWFYSRVHRTASDFGLEYNHLFTKTFDILCLVLQINEKILKLATKFLQWEKGIADETANEIQFTK